MVPTPAQRSSVSKAFKVPAVWVPPVALMALLVLVMTLVYLGSIIDPAGHLNGLPVNVVDQGQGAAGRQVAGALSSSPKVNGPLAIKATTMEVAQRRMDEGKAYVTVVIPRGFTEAAGGGGGTGAPTIQLLTNPRAGTVGVSLASAVLTPALSAINRAVVVRPTAYRPPPRHSGLGLSAFYIAILTTFCGFLGGVIVHTSLDAVLGYATIEVGPKWSQRQPTAITRWHTLLAKWALVIPLTLLFTGLMLFAATVVLGMDTPHFPTLWLLAWCSAAVIGIGTLTLFAVLGTPGQIAALLIFVYLALASSGGTVPLQALGGLFHFLGEFEPMRQIVAGTRSVLYFDASGTAGLTRAFVGAGAGLVLWVVIGAAATTWYDRKGYHRASPELLEYIDTAVKGYPAPTPRQR